MTEIFDVTKIRQGFPILQTEVKGKPLVYFDNAATNQKPKEVIEALEDYYSNTNANIHRGIHYLSEKATAAYEDTRKAVAQFLGAAEPEEIIFTKGTTEGINLVAQTYGRQNLKKGDEVLISTMEHHSNIVPWQMICEETGATLKVIPINDAGEIIWDEFENLLSEKTKILSIVYVSNALGTINPVKKMIDKAHEVGAVVMVDGAQSTSHIQVNVQELDADFYAFSGHKVYGPTGMGALYGKRSLLESMPPYQGGGEMIAEVTFEKTTYNELPYKFEAGTPNIGDVIAFHTALNYVESIGLQNIYDHEHELMLYATGKMLEIKGLNIIGQAQEKTSVVSFHFEDVHHQDLAIMLDNYGIAIRTGHHCTQPLMQRFGILGTSRVSFAVYNTKEEIDYFIDSLHKVLNILR